MRGFLNSRFVLIFALILMMSATSSAQAKYSDDPCHAMQKHTDGSARTFLGFREFNKELRDALTRQDATALAFLVTFPLRVNETGGTISLDDAGALKKHFEDVFTPAVRKEILSNELGGADCGPEGIGYARGVIWVNASERGYTIWSVNRDAVAPYKNMIRRYPKIEFVCQTQTHRIAVETTTDGTLRYRDWDKPRLISESPNLELHGGEPTFEGTNVCAVPVFTFHKGKFTYRVNGGLGCFDADHVPKDAVGSIEVDDGTQTPNVQWCY